MTSSIVTSQPASGSSGSSAVVRGNFQNAANDITALQAQGTKPGTPPVPSLLFGGANVGMTGTFGCEIVRTGDIVVIEVVIALTAVGSSTGTATITSSTPAFPAPHSSSGIRLRVGPWASVGTADVSAVLSGTTISLYNGPPNGSAVLTNSSFSSASTLVISGSYIAA